MNYTFEYTDSGPGKIRVVYLRLRDFVYPFPQTAYQIRVWADTGDGVLKLVRCTDHVYYDKGKHPTEPDARKYVQSILDSE